MRTALLTLLVVTTPLAVGSAAAYHDYDGSSDGNVTILRGPPDAATLADAAEIRAAHKNGTLRMSTSITYGETLVIAFRSPALNDKYVMTDGPNTTARFYRALNRSGGTLTVQRVDHGTERPAMFVDIDGPGVRTVRDAGNATFYLILDTDALKLETDDGDSLQQDLLAPGELGVTVKLPTEDAGDAANDDDWRRLTTLLTIRDPKTEVTNASTGVEIGRPLYLTSSHA